MMMNWKHIILVIVAAIPLSVSAQTFQRMGSHRIDDVPTVTNRIEDVAVTEQSNTTKSVVEDKTPHKVGDTKIVTDVVINDQNDETRLGNLIVDPADSTRKRKKLARRLIIEKGDVQLGLQISYASISSDDSELFMLAKNMDGNGSYFQFAPVFAYSYKDNHAIGVRFKYAKAEAKFNNLDLDFLSDDLKFNITDFKALTNTIQISMLHRSYVGLDRKGRFGLYVDLLAGYVRSRTEFRYNAETQDTYTAANKFKFTVSPGFVVFPMNRVSVNVSLGIFNATYSRMSYYEHDECTGYRNSFKAKAGLSIFDLFFGVTFHL